MTTLSHSPKTVGTIEPAWVPYSARLRVSPYEVAVGETVVVTGEEFAPGAKVELVWHSAVGRYESTDAGEFVGQRYERAVSTIATAVANKRGHIRSSFAIPLDFGGAHEAVVDGETGYVVAPKHVVGVRDAIDRLTKDDARRTRMGAAALARAKGEFDYDSLAAVLRRVAAGGLDALEPLALG